MSDNIELDANLGGMAGYIQITVVGEDGKVKYAGEKFKNLLTNYLFDTYFTGGYSPQTLTNHCAVGTSNTAPAVDNTSLGTQVGGRVFGSGGYFNSGSPNYIITLDRTYAFAQGAITGNIAEVGFFRDPTGNSCGSRSLIKDSGGTPTTITLLSTDTLTVRYYLQYVPNVAGGSGVHVISGVNYNYTWMPAGLVGAEYYTNALSTTWGTNGFAYSTQTLPSPGNTPDGAANSFSSVISATYVNGNLYRDHTINADIGSTNHFGGIGIVALQDSGYSYYNGFYISYTPKIPKDNTKTLSLTYRLSYSRV